MFSERPRIKPVPSATDTLMDWACTIILLLVWIYVFASYSSLPNSIPVHFNFQGKADSYGNKVTLFVLPIIITAVIIGMTWLNKYPNIFNYPKKITEENAAVEYANATRLLRIIKLVIAVFIGVIIVYTVQGAKNGSSQLPWWLPISFIICMIAPIIFYVWRMLKK